MPTRSSPSSPLAGLLDDGRLTGAGRELAEQIQATVTEATRPVWQGLPEDDVAATTRVLNEVLARARTVLTGVRRARQYPSDDPPHFPH
jgi:hypothetical protein